MEQYLKYKNILDDELELDQKHLHVVVDTNAFLSDLSFLEKLIKINSKSKSLRSWSSKPDLKPFPDYGSPIILVRYIVLQGLMLSSQFQSHFESKLASSSTKAKAAIHFLNERVKDHHTTKAVVKESSENMGSKQ